jgi:mono/diheme cytochrome c family protein
MVLAGIEVIRWRRRTGSVDTTVVIMAIVAALSSLLAVFQGWTLAENSEPSDILELHRWLGVSTAVVAVIVAVIALLRQLGDSQVLGKLYRITVLPGALLVSLTGHYGGSAMHGEDYLPLMPWELYQYFFAQKQTPAVDPNSIPDQVDFARDIDPIFAKHCYECHNDEKQKGELRMDSRAWLVKGGDGGTAIIPGKGKESLLVIRLFDGDDPRMPKKKPSLSPRQIALITKWIDQGAEWPASVPASKANPDKESETAPHPPADTLDQTDSPVAPSLPAAAQ